MYRMPQAPLTINMLANSGGVGDVIASLPAVNYILKYHPHVSINFWVGDFIVEFAQRSLPKDPRIKIRGFTDIKDYDNTLYARAIGYGSTHTNFATHMTKHAFSMYLNVEPPVEEMNYLPLDTTGIDITKYELPEKYVCLNVGHTAVVREWLPEYITEVAKYIKDKGYTPVFLGRSESPNGAGHIIKGHLDKPIDFSLGIDLRDKTTLSEAQVVIAGAKAMVGLDCGLLHVAGTTDTAIVGGFTSVEPEHRMPIRHNVLGWNFYPVTLTPKQLACIGCQSNMSFSYGHRFDQCFHGDLLCIKMLVPDLYIEQLEKIL